MIEYPSISRDIKKGISVYAFDKIDGSHIRAEWSKKRGFYKFGSHKRLLGTDQYVIFKAEEMVKDGWSRDIEYICKTERWQRVTFFFEFVGPKSFAGMHDPMDDHELYLLDAALERGMLLPAEFLNAFDTLRTAKLLYHGFCDHDFVSSVQNSTLEGMTFEGVVCKAKGPKKSYLPTLFKIKSNAWMEKLKKHCGDDDKKFENLM